jgi:carboxypeptidase T
MSLVTRSIFVFLLFVFSVVCNSQSVYKKVRVDLQGKNFKKFLALDLDIDHARPFPGRYIDIEIPQTDVEKLILNGWKFEVLQEDLEKFYSNSDRFSELTLESRNSGCDLKKCDSYTGIKTPSNWKLGSMGGYFTYNEMLQIFDEMKLKFPHLITDKKTIGNYKTHNGNPIHWLRISNNPNQRQNKPQILYTALHHAREPVSLSQMIFFMWYVLENYDKDPVVTNILNNTELYFIPCVNPDGYIINNKNQPNGGGMWRKNAFKNSAGVVMGVDLNRNYGFQWGYDNEGSSSNANSETYRGPAAFSEPETQAISSFISDNNFRLCLNFHSHGNFLIHPWGHTSELNPDADLFNLLAGSMTKANCYSTGTGQNTVGYMVNGDADDWMYGDVVTKNRVFSFTPEVGKSFYPPKQDIIDLCKSTLNMNLTIPRMARNYSEATPFNLPVSVQDGIQKIGFVIKKIGFEKSDVRMKLSLDKGTALSGQRQAEYLSSVQMGQSDTVYFEYKVNRDIADGEEIRFNYSVFYDEIEETNTFILPYFKKAPELVRNDDFETQQGWKTNVGWGKTSLLSASGRFSLTDSPESLYRPNTVNYVDMPGTLNLSKVAGAVLKFKAKWYIEENFDNAQIQISTDGKNYLPLCGKYTRVNAFDQVVYDGFQDNWVEEEISLNKYLGSPTVYIRFVLSSDQLSQFDGMYIDDFQVETISKSLVSPNKKEEEFVEIIFPNPVNDRIFISGKSTLENYKVLNAFGQTIKSGNVYYNTINLSDLLTGTYSIELKSNNGEIVRQRFFKL